MYLILLIVYAVEPRLTMPTLLKFFAFKINHSKSFIGSYKCIFILCTLYIIDKRKRPF